ncbi:hypothetical protein SETIT_7G160800v2 [Setaria italica]|uniref:methylated diphthine methylhydrolase n=2 Tax=Setaria italica TaxID=4555 RepID=A0A368RWE9_SETIT|nr:hypothetical protein SETIT_7G160800v2 [Setaria italica]RCV34456.1 hypothetical protein SETIT_7G160800v2 [Setaria italica]
MDLGSCYLGGNADAVEFCPHRPFRHVLAAATYTLQEQEQDRAGTISLFSVDARRGGRVPAAPAAAYCIAFTDVCAEDISSSMCLYVDWNQTAESLSVGLSDGSLSVVSVREDRLEISEQWAAHQFEVWTCYFDRTRPHLLYSGSDDCCFSSWDLRESPSNIVFQNKKSHNMGVCCFAQNPFDGNMLLTGSYDEFLRVWDMRLMAKPVNEKSINLGGGVWRMKYHPSIADVVLAACMHNGFAIVKVGSGDATVMETYCKHESLAYGADWQKNEEAEQNGNSSVVATCSFYDRLIRVWQPENLSEL